MTRTQRRLTVAALCVTVVSWPSLGARADWRDVSFDGRPGTAVPAAAPEAPETGRESSIEPRFWVVLPAASRDVRTTIATEGVAIEEVGGSTVGGVADVDTLERLRRRGIVPIKKESLEKSHQSAFPTPDAAFHDFAEVRVALGAIASAHPAVASVFSIGTSVQGRDLLALRFNAGASGAQASAKPGIVFLGTHHAREHLSTEVPVRLAQWLAANKDRADVKRLLETRDVYFIPLVNPDGAEYDHADCRPDALPARRGDCSYKYHRKNMHANGNGSLGVDLNRNYGYQWGGGGASASPGSDTYRGPSAFSEPETQAVKRFVEERPNLKILLTYHTFSELILYPWGHKYDPIEDGKALGAYKAMAGKMAEMTGYTPQQSSQLYIASGDTTDWSWGAKKIFSFTFELTPKSMWAGGFYPGASAIEPTVQRNIGPMLYLIDLSDDPYRANQFRADNSTSRPTGAK